MATAFDPASLASSSHPRRPRIRQNQNPRPSSRHGREDEIGTQTQSQRQSSGIEPNLALRPASIPLRTQRGSQRQTESAASLPSGQSAHRGQRARTRRARGSRLDGARSRGEATTAGVSAAESTLHPEAPSFLPGQLQPASTRSDAAVELPVTTPSQSRVGGKVQKSKSLAADLATRIHEDILSSFYECPICTSEVTPNSKIWSCNTCWTSFHLGCIKKWSKNEGSTQAQQNRDEEPPTARQWRCPGCNLPKDTLPTDYTCWCEKEVDPRPIPGLPPHSCGQTCGKRRGGLAACPHPCESMCHAGPCAPCTRMGPETMCFCGRHTATKRCVDTGLQAGGWSCQERCGETMPCGQHTCPRTCHDGLCGACEVPLDATCYCGSVTREISCCETEEPKHSELSNSEDEHAGVKEWIGIFNCGRPCGRTFDCGKHSCEQDCHQQQARVSHCPRSPDVVTRCPCGKTDLVEITSTPRKSCEDAIPHCDKQCLRKLPCGHNCSRTCHSGDCKPCLQMVSISCRCGRTSNPSLCHQGNEERPQCMRTCKATMNCGRHECGDRCCTGERRAAERQLSKRKVRPLRTRLDEDFEAEHICTRSCGRMLKCGNHACLELCHKGPCGSCREAIFDEIACNCGRTVLQPPLPCGTTLPFCKWDCDRAKACGHPQVQHNCHSDAEPCPRCPFLTRKSCLCGKKSLANQQCWLLDVRCGEVCGKLLRCGSHHCRLPCHRPGQCEDSESACRQVCSKAKKSCGHPCQDTCHAPYPCREEKPCTHKVIITCQCQHQKQEVQCRHSKDGDGGETKQLGCVDECARLERNRKLALALNVDPKTHTDDHVPYSKDTLDGFQENRAWAIGQERLFRMFAANDEEKRIRSKPAPPAQRAFLHALAEDYGFDSESIDPEPHRHVVIFKTPRFVGPPMKTLSQCEAIRATSSRPQAVSTQSTAANAIPSFNGYLLVDPRFGLTLEDVRASFRSAFETTPALSFSINFLPSEEIVLKSSSDSLTREGMDALLRRSLAAFAAASSTNKLAASTQLCTTDDSLNVLRREPDGKETGGWSRVAARAAAPRTYKPESGVGVKSGFAILESEARRRKREEAAALKEQEKAAVAPVVEDWEQAEEEEEAAEVAGARETGKVEGERDSEDTSS